MRIIVPFLVAVREFAVEEIYVIFRIKLATFPTARCESIDNSQLILLTLFLCKHELRNKLYYTFNILFSKLEAFKFFNSIIVLREVSSVINSIKFGMYLHLFTFLHLFQNWTIKLESHRNVQCWKMQSWKILKIL